jgi:hypothetical protein
MNALNFSNIINLGSEQGLQRLNAGNLKLDNEDTPVMGALLSRKAFGAQRNLDSARPQVLLYSRALQLVPLVQELLEGCDIGLSRIELPLGRCWGAIIYESATKAVWCIFDAHSDIGIRVLKDWEQHGDMLITFMAGPLELTMRQPLTNSLIAKLLATPAPQACERNIQEDVNLMRQMAQAMGQDKQRLFVLMMEGCVFMPPSAQPVPLTSVAKAQSQTLH